MPPVQRKVFSAWLAWSLGDQHEAQVEAGRSWVFKVVLPACHQEPVRRHQRIVCDRLAANLHLTWAS